VAAEVLGRARLLPRVSHHYPSLRPDGWYGIVERNHDAIEPRARDGHVWIAVDGRIRQVWAAHFEIRLEALWSEPPGAAPTCSHAATPL
jgi:hypothetical protein